MKTDQELIAAARAASGPHDGCDCIICVRDEMIRVLADALEQADAQLAAKDAEIARLGAAMPAPWLLRRCGQILRCDRDFDLADSLDAAAARIEEVTR